MAKQREVAGNLLVGGPPRTLGEDDLFHALRPRSVVPRPNADGSYQRRRLPAFPDDARLHAVPPAALDDHLVDQGAQQRLLVRLTDVALPPELRQVLPHRLEAGTDLGRQRERRSGRPPLLSIGGLGLLEGAERCFPAPLEFGGDKAIVGIDAYELPLGHLGLVAQALQMLLM